MSTSTQPLHIPWLEFAKQLVAKAANDFDQPLVQSAITLAESGFAQKAAFIQPRDAAVTLSNPACDNAKKLKEVRIARDSAINVALAHGLSSLFEINELPGTQNDQLRKLVHNQPVPPGLSLAAPEQHLGQPGNWVSKVGKTLEDWEQRLGIRFLESEAEWPTAWNTGIALTALERLQTHAGSSLTKMQEFLLGKPDVPATPLPRFCARARGAATCIPTASPGLKVRLDCAPWLAQLLQHGKGKPAPQGADQDLLSLHFDTKRIGNQGNDTNEVRTGLKVAHLYYAVLIERLYQLSPHLYPTQGAVMTSPPPADLPPALAPLLSPPEQQVAPLAIAAMWRALVPSTPSKSIRLKTRRQTSLHALAPSLPPSLQTASDQAHSNHSEDGPINLHIRPDILQYQAPQPDNEVESFGSVRLDADELDPHGRLQWMDMVLLIAHKDQWFVLRPELVEHTQDDQRVHLATYDELPPELLASASVQRIATAMAQAQWAIHIDGHAGFVCAAINLK